MSSRIPDLATLDDMILGDIEHDDPRHAEEAWQALVRTPGGVEAWEKALARRKRIDRIAALTRAHPWLAGVMLVLRRAGRRMKRAPLFAPTAVYPPVPALDAILDQTDDVARPHVQLAWGRIVELAVPMGEVVALEYPIDVEATIYYQSAQGEGRMRPGHHWRMEAGEAPVLLVLTIGGGGAGDLSAALSRAEACAGVVLVVAEP